MDSVKSSNDSFQETAVAWMAETLSMLPSLLGALLILILGWIFARLARRLTRRLFNDVNRLMERIFQHGALSSFRFSTPARAVLAEAAFWIVLFLTLALAVRVAGFAAVAGWLNQVVTHLPNIIIGVAVIAGGYFASAYIGKATAAAAAEMKAQNSVLIGRAAQIVIIIFTLIIGLDQFGVEVTFLVMMLSVATGALLAGFSLAFGFGARDHVRNLIAARGARRELQEGLTVKIGDITGTLLEVTPSHIALDTERGRTLVPAGLVEDHPLEIISSGGGTEDG